MNDFADAMALRPAAQLLGVEFWQIQRIFELGLLPQPARFGNVRVVTKSQLPEIRAALIKRGYLPAEEPVRRATPKS